MTRMSINLIKTVIYFQFGELLPPSLADITFVLSDSTLYLNDRIVLFTGHVKKFPLS